MKNKIIIALFLLLVFGMTALDMLSPDRSFSESENRELVLFPEVSAERIFSGKFGQDYESYITDQFALRDPFIKIKFLSDRALLKAESGGVYIADDALFVKQSEVNEEYLKKNVSAMESFASKYPARFILVPSATYIARNELPPFAEVQDEKALFDELSSEFKNIGFINILPLFEEKKDMYMNLDINNLYFRTDHHWNADGALKGYNAYRKALGKGSLTKDDFVVSVVSDEFLGTSTSKSGAVGITPDILEKWERGNVLSLDVYNGKETVTYDSLYFEEYLSKKDKYSYYLGQNQPIVKIKTESDGGRLLVFKDSYAHIFTQMLLSDYSEIVLVDLRYVRERVALLLPKITGLSLEDFDEVLFLYSADTFVTESNMLWLK